MTYGDNAIKTEYKGIMFKSMIEAKYAQRFDELGLKWEYEPKNYMLSNGLNYMPDFHFLGTNTYFEVKGVNYFDEIPNKDCWKMAGFVDDFPNVFLLLGTSKGEFIQINSDRHKLIDWDTGEEVTEKNYYRFFKKLEMPRYSARYSEKGMFICNRSIDEVCLIKCGTCDTPYFANPWGHFRRQTLCPNCHAECFRGDDDDDIDKDVRRNCIYDVWKSFTLFDGDWTGMSYNDMRDWEQELYDQGKLYDEI